MKKKIIFFDGDGTLWYPKTTKYRKRPHWVYLDQQTKDNPNEHLMMVPGVLKTLKELKKLGYVLVILSANPHKIRKAYSLIKEKLNILIYMEFSMRFMQLDHFINLKEYTF